MNTYQSARLDCKGKGGVDSLVTFSFALGTQIPLGLFNDLFLPSCFSPILGQEVLGDWIP